MISHVNTGRGRGQSEEKAQTSAVARWKPTGGGLPAHPYCETFHFDTLDSCQLFLSSSQGVEKRGACCALIDKGEIKHL